MEQINCTQCGKIIVKCRSHIKKTNFCNRDCKRIFQTGRSLSEETKKKISKAVSGEKNPNFGNKWNEEQKRKQSNLIKEIYKENPDLRYKAGSANRGKKFSKERIERCHGNRSKESYIRVHSEETKRKIGEKSKKKFTKEFKQLFRKKMEEKGLWIPLHLKEDYEIYFKEANWIDRMFDRVSKEEEELINELGIFNAKMNSKGVVRDHKFSRRSGFELKVFPEILRHPCNCKILTHSENVKKKEARYKDRDSISLLTLFKEIKAFAGFWVEQEKCLKLINQYNQGKKWERK